MQAHTRAPRQRPHGEEPHRRSAPAAALRALLANALDYAGTYPPAALSLQSAIERYDAATRQPDAWMLHHFVVASAALPAVDAARSRIDSQVPWTIAVVATSPSPEELANLAQWSHAQARLAAIEIKPASLDDIGAAKDALRPFRGTVFCELPRGELDRGIAAVADAGFRAKFRTGGVDAGSIPSSAELIDFMQRCRARGLAFKLTAGLHHAVRGEYPLTADSAGPTGLMHGFLNVFVAAAWLDALADAALAQEILEDRDARAFGFSESTLTWRSQALDVESVLRARQRFALSFGSCSFDEPVEELASFGLL